MRDDQHPFMDMAAKLGYAIELSEYLDTIDASTFGATRKVYLSSPKWYALTVSNSETSWTFKGSEIDLLKAQAMVEMLK
jgi:hypothetical protein